MNNIHTRLPWRRKVIALAGVILLAALWVTPATSQPAQITFDPVEGSFDCGEVYVVSVMIDDLVADLLGFTLTIEFDPAIVNPLVVSEGSLVLGAACTNFFTWFNQGTYVNTIQIDGALLGCSVDGPGEIARLEFEGEMDGDSYVRCQAGVGNLRDSMNGEIPFECGEATIHYLCPVAANHVTWGTLKALHR